MLLLDAWKESAGVRAEVALAVELGKPVRYMSISRPSCPQPKAARPELGVRQALHADVNKPVSSSCSSR